MKFEEFILERNQSLFEHKVDYNLSESGVHPLKLSELLSIEEQREIIDMELSYGYTNGTPDLRECISNMYSEKIFSQNILVTSGSAEANFLAFMTQLEKGDEIIYMVPNYLQIKHLAQSFGIKVIDLPLRQDLGWQWSMDELQSMISNKTKMIVICNPNNPTGSIMPHSIMDKIIDIAQDCNCWILSDEVYRGSELDGVECRSFAGATNKTIVNGGLSKAYSLPGIRIGWTIGSEDYIKKVWAFHDYTVINVSILSDWIASKILDTKRRKKILQRTKKHLNKNLDLLMNWEKNISELSVTRPDSAAISFAKLNIPISSEKFVLDLRDKYSVLLTAGNWHGLEGYIRIGYGGDYGYVERGLDRLKNFIKSL